MRTLPRKQEESWHGRRLQGWSVYHPRKIRLQGLGRLEPPEKASWQEYFASIGEKKYEFTENRSNVLHGECDANAVQTGPRREAVAREGNRGEQRGEEKRGEEKRGGEQRGAVKVFQCLIFK